MIRTAVCAALTLYAAITVFADTVAVGSAPDQDFSYISEAPEALAAAESSTGAVSGEGVSYGDAPVVGEAPAASETAAPAETESPAAVPETEPFAQAETAAPEVLTGEAPAAPPAETETAAPETSAPAESLQEMQPVSLSGPGAALGGTNAAVTGYNGTAGSAHAGDAASELALDFKLISPAVPKGDIYVAEGSVMLSDGSWAEIGHNYNLRAPYYRLLREQTDSTGVPWYICAVYGTRIGDYRMGDGSIARELWLKKSDCRETSSLLLNTQSEIRRQIVRTALSNLGKQYSYAAKGPDAFDCSGFVWYIYNQAGISLPRSSYEICDMGGTISQEELRPGDIVGRYGHVGIYIGGGVFVHASETNVGVISERLDMYNRTNSFTHYINAIGD